MLDGHSQTQTAMRTPSRLRALAALTAAALLAACSSGSDDTTAPPSGQPLNVSQLYAELTVPGVSSAISLMAGSLPVPTISTSITGSCPYDAASKSFVCTPSTSNGLTYAVSYTLLDAAGNALNGSADRSTTAAMRTLTTVSGTLTLPAGTGGTASATALQISQRSDMTLSGLLGATHTVNGTSTATVGGTISLGGVSTALSSTTTQTTKDLVLPAASTAGTPQYPTSGTVTVDASSTIGAGTPALATRAVMTFNGTSTATLTITSGGATQRCTVNLATQSPPACVAG